ncbi:hypothetical protein [Phytohabitans kaempferiae]|uniref:Uncharacterized protein n=1 Tax=Phytohabitans kaempferiae TaxID=1620943 RepID=A0ABV6LXG5_9ACTN
MNGPVHDSTVDEISLHHVKQLGRLQPLASQPGPPGFGRGDRDRDGPDNGLRMCVGHLR